MAKMKMNGFDEAAFNFNEWQGTLGKEAMPFERKVDVLAEERVIKAAETV